MNMVLSPSPPEQTIFIAGPTASGKSAVALALAEMIDAEIVSADAYQVYREMPILTATPSSEDLARVAHSMIGFLEVTETWDATLHYTRSMECIRDIHARGKRALVVGGSGLYLKFLTHGLSKAPPGDAALRATFAKKSLEELVELLRKADPEGAQATSLENRRYVERNLEIILVGGKPLSYWRQNWLNPPAGPGWVLDCDVDNLDQRIARRTETMFEAGVLDEVAKLPLCSVTAAKTLGLPQIKSCLAGEITQEECKKAVALATRQYAKRQRTWLRRESWLRKLTVTPFSSFLNLAFQVRQDLL
ncbi:MAG: tRNA (adenosine(37)-N6)-dimethylallyltransferase MiaA [Akkermansia sp.]